MKRFMRISVGIFISLLALGVSRAAPARELTFNTYQPATHYLVAVFKQFIADVEKESQGSLKIVLYPGATLTKANGVFDGLINGVSDIGFSSNGYNPGRFPLMEVTDLSFTGVKSSERMSQITWDTYKRFRPKEFDKIKLLGVVNMARSGVNSNIPITRLADLKGQRIRGTGNDVDIVKALGATPVAMPITDAYVALQKGIADGILANYPAMKAFKLGEVAKTSLEFFFRQTTFWYGMSPKTYNSLTPDQQKIMTDLGEKYVRLLGAAVDAQDKVGRDWMTSIGHRYTTLAPGEAEKWEAALKPTFDKYISDKSAMGLPAREAVDFVRSEIKK